LNGRAARRVRDDHARKLVRHPLPLSHTPAGHRRCADPALGPRH